MGIAEEGLDRNSYDWPSRYEALGRLGSGGGGEVWKIRDRYTDRHLALKLLDADFSYVQRAALVREALALQTLSAIGIPAPNDFGRSTSGRLYLSRELVAGEHLSQWLKEQKPTETALLEIMCTLAELVGKVHRAGFFHGDIKPENIIIQDGQPILVDFGLSAPFNEAGTPAPGLTPEFAGPELLQGAPLTARAEVYSLAATLRFSFQSIGVPLSEALEHVISRAHSSEASERYPSVDEYLSALRRAGGLPPSHRQMTHQLGLPAMPTDEFSRTALELVEKLGAGSALWIEGGEGSGRSTLLKRIAWDMSISGRTVIHLCGDFDERLVRNDLPMLKPGTVIAVDDWSTYSSEFRVAVREAVCDSASTLLITALKAEPLFSDELWPMPQYATALLAETLCRAVPCLSAGMAEQLVVALHHNPSQIDAMACRLAEVPVLSPAEIEAIGRGDANHESLPGGTPAQQIRHLLDSGRDGTAESLLDQYEQRSSLNEGERVIFRARLAIAQGEPARAQSLLAERSGPEADMWQARAQIGLGLFEEARSRLSAHPLDEESQIGGEASAYLALAENYLGDCEGAIKRLQSVNQAHPSADRARIISLCCLGLIQQQAGQIEEARLVLNQAISDAEHLGDGGNLAVLYSNRGVIERERGKLAQALLDFEASADIASKVGRRSALQHALLNLANMDLYLGRLSRARAAIDALEGQLGAEGTAQDAMLFGLRAELAALSGEGESARYYYGLCAKTYRDLGHHADAIESELELLVLSLEQGWLNPLDASGECRRLAQEIGEHGNHRELLAVAESWIKRRASDWASALSFATTAIEQSRNGGNRDWEWRALALRAQLYQSAGQHDAASADFNLVVTLLSQAAASLPADLRETFWSDPRRAPLRQKSAIGGLAAGSFAPRDATKSEYQTLLSPVASPLEVGLASLLEINRGFFGGMDSEGFCDRVSRAAEQLFESSCALVLLYDSQGALQIGGSEPGDSERRLFSRSVAEKAIASDELFLSLNAQSDANLSGSRSVHTLDLTGVACVPLRRPLEKAMGALYIELEAGKPRDVLLLLLRAMADQISIALEANRLQVENSRRTEELERSNARLAQANQEIESLLSSKTQALEKARQKILETDQQLQRQDGRFHMVGASASMNRLYSLIERVANNEIPALITGESGTGKELVARALHESSSRVSHPFLALNCGAIPEHLLESEIFGHVKGAFTSADRERKGLLREAGEGTVFLDEIGEMPPRMQTALLRVLQERQVTPVGSAASYPVRARFVFATHRDLKAMIAEGSFREDLYYRIHVVELNLPPLRSRLEDLPSLVQHFLGKFSLRYRREAGKISADALSYLQKQDWPGNIRQLEHVLLAAWIFAESGELSESELRRASAGALSETEPEISGVPGRSSPPQLGEGSDISMKTAASHSQHRRHEREAIIAALQAAQWNRAEAARIIGMPRRTFYRRLRDYGIQ